MFYSPSSSLFQWSLRLVGAALCPIFDQLFKVLNYEHLNALTLFEHRWAFYPLAFGIACKYFAITIAETSERFYVTVLTALRARGVSDVKRVRALRGKYHAKHGARLKIP